MLVSTDTVWSTTASNSFQVKIHEDMPRASVFVLVNCEQVLNEIPLAT